MNPGADEGATQASPDEQLGKCLGRYRHSWSWIWLGGAMTNSQRCQNCGLTRETDPKSTPDGRSARKEG